MKVFDQCMVGLAFLHLMMVSRQQHAAPGVLAGAMQLSVEVPGTSAWLEKRVHCSKRTITSDQRYSAHPCCRTCLLPAPNTGGHPGCEEDRGAAHLLRHPVDL